MKLDDPYVSVFSALADRDEQAVPFFTLTHIEINNISHDGIASVVLHYQDLVTGEKKTHRCKLKMGRPNTVWNPFTNKGPYFVNSVENVAKEFRIDDESGGNT